MHFALRYVAAHSFENRARHMFRIDTGIPIKRVLDGLDKRLKIASGGFGSPRPPAFEKQAPYKRWKLRRKMRDGLNWEMISQRMQGYAQRAISILAFRPVTRSHDLLQPHIGCVHGVINLTKPSNTHFRLDGIAPRIQKTRHQSGTRRAGGIRLLRAPIRHVRLCCLQAIVMERTP